MEKRLNLTVVIFSSGHQQTHPVGNQVLYWQLSSALNTIPWMTNTECREQGSRYCHCMGQASLTKGFWRSAKADFWRKLKGDKMVGSAALHTPPRLQAPISHSLKEKKNWLIFANTLQFEMEQSQIHRTDLTQDTASFFKYRHLKMNHTCLIRTLPKILSPLTV